MLLLLRSALGSGRVGIHPKRPLPQMTTALSGGAVRLIDSPIRFMQAQAVSRPPRMVWALIPVVLNALFVGGAGVITQSRITVLAPGMPEPATAPGLPILVTILGAVAMGLLGFVVHAGAVVMLDMLAAQSGQWQRLAELSAVAYWSQLLWSVPALAAMWWLFDPPPMVLRGAGADVMQAVLRYGEQLAAEPLQIVMTRTQQMAGLWLIALHACVLRVVSGFTMIGTWVAGIVLTLLFVGVPVAFGTAVQRFFF